MKVSTENLNRQYRILYEFMSKEPRVHFVDISPTIGLSQPYVSKRAREAFEQQRISGPEIRRCSYGNLEEFMYFIKCEDPESLYLNLRKDQRVCFHAGMSGFCDIWVIAREEINFEGDIIVQGVRSDFYVSKPPDHSWEDALKIMTRKVETFDPEKYIPRNYVQTHWDETTEWDEKDELLFRYFKYNLRRPLSPILEKHLVSADRLYQWFAKLPQCCTVFTSYFPEGFPSYESHLYMFETDYEDFMVEVFSELAATSFFFKVSDKLFTYIHVPKRLIRGIDLETADGEKYIPLLIRKMVEKGIVKRKAGAMAYYFWGKDL